MRTRLVGWVLCFGLFAGCPAHAGWEATSALGFDSNVDRAVTAGTSDWYLWGRLGQAWEGRERGVFRPTFEAALDGTVWAEHSDLSALQGTLTPGVGSSLWNGWSLALAPFLRVQAVRDSDQSSAAFGAKLGLSQPLSSRFSLGEYYLFTRNEARESAFSYTEHALGVLLAAAWTAAFSTELSYEFAWGDSFVSFREPETQTAAKAAPGRGRGNQSSGTPLTANLPVATTEGAVIVRENVHRHTFGLAAGLELRARWTALAGYNLSREDTSVGTVESHSGFVGLSYRR
jgi:hypothetical protein